MVLSRDNYRTRFRSSAVLPLSLTISLTPWRLVDLLYVTLAYADDNSKLVDVVSVADVNDFFSRPDVNDEDRVVFSYSGIFGHFRSF